MKSKAKSFVTASLFAACANAAIGYAADNARAPDRIESVVDTAVRPVIAKCNIPGKAVGVIVAEKPCVFGYGVASTDTRQPVTRGTLFEIGSITETFTATLASYAPSLRLSLPYLQGSKFGEVTLLHLGTHTPGGLRLQVPAKTGNNDQLVQYFKDWQPTYEPGK